MLIIARIRRAVVQPRAIVVKFEKRTEAFAVVAKLPVLKGKK